MRVRWTSRTLVVLGVLGIPAVMRAADDRPLRQEYQDVVRPFLATYCIGCHGRDRAEAKFDLSPYTSFESVVRDLAHWELALRRIREGEMPPEDADKHPGAELRQQVAGWIERVRRHEAARTSGDPGPVLARRLSNAEYNYAIQDLTGADIQPAREFPIDPANRSGFDNSGESLTMSPALLNKYLDAARHVADHLVFLPDGIVFAPHPAVVYSDRDKFAVRRIIDFYKRQPVDYADYFYAAWTYHYRSELGVPEVTLEQIAAQQGVSRKYVASVWELLSDSADHAGPVAQLREAWRALPKFDDGKKPRTEAVRAACHQLQELVLATRRELNLPEGDFRVEALNPSSQPIILWKNREIAARRRLGKLPERDGTSTTDLLRAAITRFCGLFPDTFYVSERGRMFLAPEEREKGRLLNAGFHLMLGYFRDDGPLYDLVLDHEQQAQLDTLWRELDFITRAPLRQYSDYLYFERAEQPGILKSEEFAFAREDAGDVTSPENMKRLADLYLAKARSREIDGKVLEVIEAYFDDMSRNIRRLEESLSQAEPAHVQALQALAARAWQRPLDLAEQEELASFYRSLKHEHGLAHEDAVRDTLVSILMSPRFCYRTIAAEPGVAIQPISDEALASRLSFFLWSSIPDDELVRLAADKKLRHPEVLGQQVQRMLRDPRIRRLAVEFGGHWLDFRQFEMHQGVNRERFPGFTDELRLAMYDEPIRFFTDLIQRNGSALELLSARHTFVNGPLAEHYGIPFPVPDSQQWVRIEDADRFGRGGLLPMSVFLTKNSPGLRTSPVKRGYWVVRQLLGEHIPAPPPEVPELPESEEQLGTLSLREVLARHREAKSCAACHRRFDSLGLAFEGYGPVGERRERDLGGRAVDATAQFPDLTEGDGLEGLRNYLLASRQADFIENLCRKMLSYALGRSLILSDEATIDSMKARLAADNYRWDALVETIVASPQFLHRRGRDFETHRPEDNHTRGED